MKKKLPDLVYLLFLLTIFLYNSSFSKIKSRELNSIKAVVNGSPITSYMLDKASKYYIMRWKASNRRNPSNKEIKKIKKEALEELITKELILSAFDNLGGKSGGKKTDKPAIKIKNEQIDMIINDRIKNHFKGDRKKFMSDLKKNNISLTDYRQRIINEGKISIIKNKFGSQSIIPNTLQEKKQKYNEIKKDLSFGGTPVVRLMSLPLQTESKPYPKQKKVIDKIVKQLKSGKSFSSIAKKHSQDSFASKGGYVGVLTNDVLNEKLTSIARKLPEGGFSGIVQGNFLRIVKVDKKINKKVKSFKEVEDKIDSLLTSEKKDKKIKLWVNTIRKNANIKIY